MGTDFEKKLKERAASTENMLNSEGCIIDGKYLKTSSSLLKLTKNL
ncbi:MbeB family mobilization protein [Salmonella enterica]|nr:MbeB family mobilization protein [Salmonella enterica]